MMLVSAHYQAMLTLVNRPRLSNLPDLRQPPQTEPLVTGWDEPVGHVPRRVTRDLFVPTAHGSTFATSRYGWIVARAADHMLESSQQRVAAKGWCNRLEPATREIRHERLFEPPVAHSERTHLVSRHQNAHSRSNATDSMLSRPLS